MLKSRKDVHRHCGWDKPYHSRLVDQYLHTAHPLDACNMSESFCLAIKLLKITLRDLLKHATCIALHYIHKKDRTHNKTCFSQVSSFLLTSHFAPFLFYSSDSTACEAMVFRVTEDGIIKADTLCEFTKKPQGATRLVGQKHQVRGDIDVCT